jgi:hypothetical protein
MNRFPLHSVWTGLMLLCLSACVSPLQKAQKATPATTAQTKAAPTQSYYDLWRWDSAYNNKTNIIN